MSKTSQAYGLVDSISREIWEDVKNLSGLWTSRSNLASTIALNINAFVEFQGYSLALVLSHFLYWFVFVGIIRVLRGCPLSEDVRVHLRTQKYHFQKKKKNGLVIIKLNYLTSTTIIYTIKDRFESLRI